MAVPTSSLPGVGVDVRSISDQKIYNALQELQTILTGAADSTNLGSALNAILGVTDSSVRRGKSIIATTESRTNTAYGTLTTPDKVSSIVLPTDGLICVAYQATWQESVQNTARAAIFLGANQLRKQDHLDASGTSVQEAISGSTTAAKDTALSTYPNGLISDTVGPGSNADVQATTGQAVGTGINAGAGVCYIFAAAGTYDVSVQFKASSGSVAAKNRKLWVWTMGF